VTTTDDHAVSEEQIRFDLPSERRLYESLSDYWHPVAYASQLGDEKPIPATLLGEALVLARLGGEVRAFRDLCAHRGTALSLGWVEDGALRCAYHGWKYGSDGMCTEIPARFGASIPPRARLTPFVAAEAAGLIWVCLSGEPRYPLPEFPYFEDPAYRMVEVDVYDWNCSMQRRIENYVDFAHFAWVHDGVLGDKNEPEVPEHGIGRVGGELRFDHPHMSEPADSAKNASLENDGSPVAVEIDYRLFMPNTILVDQSIPQLSQRYLLFFSVCPTGPKTSRCFTFMGRDYGFDDQTDQDMLDFNELVISQDLPIVQSQRPEELPMDLSAEVQIRGADKVAVEYRRWLKEISEGVL
jgi:phenylpropionate dioxygenase-like ring-hydroxylating dioxygenase large terminal subunit